MRALQKAELPYTCYEVGSQVGGLWRYDNDNGMSHIYQTLHTNTSSERTCFSDFPMPEDYPRNRLGLARWLIAENNPLTTRVTVNRFWQELFGVGLIKSPENFGVQSEFPLHPQPVAI